jgi:Nucleotidyltransferase of unknown function (DUF6036)
MDITDETLDLLLGALADQLQALGSHVEIVVIGGSALTALGLVRRATRDVDVLAIAENGELRLAEGLPPALLTARADQIHFKLFAMVDQGGGRHETDLRALSPTEGELTAAARWSITQDPSPGYRSALVDALRVLGVDNADLGA